MSALLDLPNVWASVGTEDLPRQLVVAFDSHDWPGVREELRPIMDGAITDGRYGRELLQLVLAIPPGLDPLFERYRVAAMLDHGDWDGLRACFSTTSLEAADIEGKRDILTAPIDRKEVPHAEMLPVRLALELCEYQTRNATGLLRHWMQRISGFYPDALWAREDVAIGRHLRYRQLHDKTLLAVAEAQGGRLPVAYALATEAGHLGDEDEPMRAVAADLAGLARLAMGHRSDFEVRVPARIRDSTGPSPLGAAEMSLYLMPLLALRDDEWLLWSARLLGHISARLASPRLQLIADTWRIAAHLRSGVREGASELAGLAAQARRATPGLKALPTFLTAYTYRRYEGFANAERLARRSGNVWLQVSALTWMTALDPQERVGHRLRRLLDITGWRRPILVPSDAAADAALGLTSLGERSEAILDFALTADRPNVTTAVATRYIDDETTALSARLAAIDALGRVGTTHAREMLAGLAQRHDEIGRAAARAVERPSPGLSEREIEVLSLAAQGMTNKRIGERLALSPHTIARHLANGRSKLGAANRAEAAVLLQRRAD